MTYDQLILSSCQWHRSFVLNNTKFVEFSYQCGWSTDSKGMMSLSQMTDQIASTVYYLLVPSEASNQHETSFALQSRSIRSGPWFLARVQFIPDISLCQDCILPNLPSGRYVLTLGYRIPESLQFLNKHFRPNESDGDSNHPKLHPSSRIVVQSIMLVYANHQML